MEDVTRFGFSLIDEGLFPLPSWLLREELIDVKVADHALLIAEKHRQELAEINRDRLKLNYGAIDDAKTELGAIKEIRETFIGFQEPSV